MNKSMAEQMQSFALSMHSAFVEHVQTTLVKQLETVDAMRRPWAERMDQLATNMSTMLSEQTQLLAVDVRKPALDQVREFSARVQSIMSEQMQLFMAGTQNPSAEEMQEFVSSMQDVMVEQMKFAAEVQGLMMDQMGELTANLRQAMAELTGRVE